MTDAFYHETSEVIESTAETVELEGAPCWPFHLASVTTTNLTTYHIACSCGWEGKWFDAAAPDATDAIDGMAEQWMQHKRLSAQVARRAKKFRKQPNE